MSTWKPDPTFYPSPELAMQGPAEGLAYVALLAVDENGRSDAIGVVDTDPDSSSYGTLVGQTEFPTGDNELHHFGWNACSSHLCPYAPHAHIERRYLLVPGTRSSRIHILDTKPNPRQPELVKVIEGDEVARRTGYAGLHTVHCGPEGVYINAFGNTEGDGPGGIFMLDHKTFDISGPWEKDRGSQYLTYDFWWHLGYDTMITSEWGTPNMVKDGVNPELLLGGKYGHALHVWDVKKRRNIQTLDLGSEHQMTLVLLPAHNPTRAYGFVCAVISLEDLSSSVWMWYLDRKGRGNGRDKGRGEWKIKKIISIPAEPADATELPPLLHGFGAVPPLITDINLSLDDRMLYISCWGTGELRQYDVSDPHNPVLKSTVRIGGIVNRTPHPKNPSRALNGAPQMIEVSRDGRRLYLTNSLYTPWDVQFYPDGIQGWMAKLDVTEDGMVFDHNFFLEFEDGQRPHQVRLEGGDSTSDSFCYS